MDASPQLQQLMDNTDPCEIVFDWFKNLKNSSFINDGKNKIETSENETICSPTMVSIFAVSSLFPQYSFL